MKQLVITIGLPGSGLNSWAKKYIRNHPNTFRLCKEELKNVFGSIEDEKLNYYRDLITKKELSEGNSVIWVDNNLSIIDQQRARELAEVYNAKLVFHDQTDIPLEECIKQDLKQPNSVGEKAIRQMYNKYLSPTNINNFITGVPLAIICDLDQTLSLPGTRDLFDTDTVDQDQINISIAEIIKSLYGKFTIILLSARHESALVKTEKWLEKYTIPYDKLYLCGHNTKKEARDLKEKVYRKEIEGNYNILVAIDDDPEVCRMWHQMGINVLKIGDPDS